MTADTQAPAPAPAPTADMVLVPREPTREMWAAFRNADEPGHISFHAAYRAMLAASPTPSPVPVGVKELVWEHRPYAPSPWIASSAVGDYRIQGLGWRLNDGPWSGGMDDVDAAKAAAQADFTRRIHSCVTTPLAGEAGAVEALNEARQVIALHVAAASIRDPAIRTIDAALSLTPPKAETETASEAPQEERNDYITDAQATEMFIDPDDDEPLSDRIRVCDGEWVKIPGGYYFDKSAGPLHPETATACDQCAVAITDTPAETASKRERREGADRGYGLGFTRGMTAEQLDEAERHCSAMFGQRGEHGGSPGEYWAEALMEIETARSALSTEAGR